jgi:hypothetical protein
MTPLKIKERTFITCLLDTEHILTILDPVLGGINAPREETFIILANSGETRKLKDGP